MIAVVHISSPSEDNPFSIRMRPDVFVLECPPGMTDERIVHRGTRRPGRPLYVPSKLLPITATQVRRILDHLNVLGRPIGHG